MSEPPYLKHFPREEFNIKLEEVLKNKPLEIKEKELQDFIYDILEQKGTCTINNLVSIFTTWPKMIEGIMGEKGYLKMQDLNEGLYILMTTINRS